MVLLFLVWLFMLVRINHDPDLQLVSRNDNTFVGRHTRSMGPNRPNSLSRSCSVAS